MIVLDDYSEDIAHGQIRHCKIADVALRFMEAYIMRTLMLLASVAMTVAGVFCVANGSAAFLTVAFIVGVVFLLMGAAEILIGLRADFDVSENAVSITKDGIIMLIFGAVIITGMITDDTTAQMLFAMWMVIEGILSFSFDKIDVMHITGEERLSFALTFLMLIMGLYIRILITESRKSGILSGITLISLKPLKRTFSKSTIQSLTLRARHMVFLSLKYIFTRSEPWMQ